MFPHSGGTPGKTISSRRGGRVGSSTGDGLEAAVPLALAGRWRCQHSLLPPGSERMQAARTTYGGSGLGIEYTEITPLYVRH